MLVPVIEIISDTKRRVRAITGDAVSVGRGRDNSLAYNDTMLSRAHCVFERDGSNVMLRDLESQNGTFVNENRIEKIRLRPGDHIRIGHIEMVFTLEEISLPDKNATKEKQNRDDLADDRDKRAMRRPSEDLVTSDDSTIVGRKTTLTETSSSSTALFGTQKEGATSSDDDLNELLPPGQTPVEKPVRKEQKVRVELPRAPQLIDRGGDREEIVDQVEADDSDEAVFDATLEQGRQLETILDSLADHRIDDSNLLLRNARGHIVPAPTVRGLEAVAESGKHGPYFLRLLLLMCLRVRATDLHIEFRNALVQVRGRIDGVMVDVIDLHPVIGQKMQRFVKVLTDIDITQPQAIQEGHFSSDVPERRVHYRVSFTPAIHGQKLVIRVLDVAHAPSTIKDLGLSDWMEGELRQVVERDGGMLLVSGPTGAGKTSTLYSLIRGIDRQSRNVVTIEDPVEYEIERTTQLPINELQGNSFATMLRSVLRQDPDVLLIGEIRDSETANIAMQAALTGHLVFSTVHARDTVGTIFRLLDLDVEPYLVGSALQFVLAQRLARVLCDECKRARQLTPMEIRLLNDNRVQHTGQVYEPIGCARCFETGFHGRVALFELLTTTAQLRDVILKNPQMAEIRKAIQSTMFSSLHESGYRLAADGVTSIKEIDRVIGSIS